MPKRTSKMKDMLQLREKEPQGLDSGIETSRLMDAN